MAEMFIVGGGVQGDKLTLDSHNKLAAGSVPGLVVHFVSDDGRSLFELGPRLLSDQDHPAGETAAVKP